MGAPAKLVTGDARNGDSIAMARKARGLTQQQLASRAAISVSLLRKIENGYRSLTPGVRSALAKALGPAPPGNPLYPTLERIDAALPLFRQTMDSYDIPAEVSPRVLPELRAAVRQATCWRLASRYTELATALPGLLAELTTLALTRSGREQHEAFGLLALTYRAADAIADKHGCHDLSARAIELTRWAAARSGDPLLEVMAAYVRAELFFTGTHARTGLRALDTAAGTIPPDRDTRALAMYGALQMRAAVLAARAGESDEALQRMTDAHGAARHVPDGIYNGTAFGPSSVRVHEVAASAEAGDTSRTLHLAARWQPPRSLPAERRSHYYIEVARARCWAGQRDQALAALQQARQAAPQHTRRNPHVRTTVECLMRTSPRPSTSLIRFTAWLGLTPDSSQSPRPRFSEASA
jgi:transcriptional regulator with XRE-family HTH domain